MTVVEQVGLVREQQLLWTPQRAWTINRDQWSIPQQLNQLWLPSGPSFQVASEQPLGVDGRHAEVDKPRWKHYETAGVPVLGQSEQQDERNGIDAIKISNKLSRIDI